MKNINVRVRGVVPLLQHRHPFKEELEKQTVRKSGSKKYDEEWKTSLYYDESIGVYQPAVHLEACLIRAAASFQVAGRGKRTYKDLFRSAVFVSPEAIPLHKREPDFLDRRMVRVQASRVERVRPGFTDWNLEFSIQVLDDQLSTEVVNEVLSHAGRFVGIGDFRPRFGRFVIERFEV